jgi:hypothetical protein
MVRKAKEWLREVSFIVVITLLRKELNDQDDIQSALIRNLIKRNIKDKEENINDLRHGPTT